MDESVTACDSYYDALDLPDPTAIIVGILSHAVFNFNMAGAGILSDVENIPEYLSDCDAHQLEHLVQFAGCIGAAGIISGVSPNEIRGAFHDIRESMDDLYVSRAVEGVSLEEVFFHDQKNDDEA